MLLCEDVEINVCVCKGDRDGIMGEGERCSGGREVAGSYMLRQT